MVALHSKKVKVREFDNAENAIMYKRSIAKSKYPYLEVKRSKKGTMFRVYSL